MVTQDELNEEIRVLNEIHDRLRQMARNPNPSVLGITFNADHLYGVILRLQK